MEEATLEKCANCRQGPSGIEGHERLFSHTMTGDLMQFKCRACGCIWSRRYGAKGTFVWTMPAGEHPGMETPGRPGTARP